MTKTQVEVITSVEGRRRWPRAEKERIVAAVMELGAIASGVAREAGMMHASQLHRWRQELCGPAGAVAGFAAVTIAPEPSLASPISQEGHRNWELPARGADPLPPGFGEAGGSKERSRYIRADFFLARSFWNLDELNARLPSPGLAS